jgi:hypothetical protein
MTIVATTTRLVRASVPIVLLLLPLLLAACGKDGSGGSPY